MNRMIHWDSPHELNAYRLLDSNPAVLSFSDQPCVIHYRLGGEEFRHYPDSLVKTATVSALWEIKTKANARKEEVVARTRLLTEHLPAYGYEYSIVLAEDLARQPRLKNVQTLLKYGRAHLLFEQKEYARRLFSTIDSLRWQDVVDARYAPFTFRQACRLVLDGALYLNLDAALGLGTVLTKVPGADLFGDGNG